MARPLWMLSIAGGERVPRYTWLADLMGFVCGMAFGAMALLWLLWLFA